MNSWRLCIATLAAALPIWAQTAPDQLLLKDYKPRSIFKIPETRIEKARYPIIDVHSHAYLATPAEIDRWVQIMDQVGVEKSVILSGATGAKFDELAAAYAKHPGRFELWCGFDYTGADQPGFSERALAELERCHKAGAKGVGELSDKGAGLSKSAPGLHCDDPRLAPLFERCADLRLPVNIHIGEDEWMYQPMDEHNDGLMNAFKWKIPKSPDVLGHDKVLATLDRMAAKHPRTTIIACHFANCCADLNKLGAMFDKYPNLYADIGARFAEVAPIPRFMNRFFTKYQDRLLYGTDNTPHPEMYRTSFRILESDDEHFYPAYFSKYHWPHHGFALAEPVLKKLYRDNFLKITR